MNKRSISRALVMAGLATAGAAAHAEFYYPAQTVQPAVVAGAPGTVTTYTYTYTYTYPVTTYTYTYPIHSYVYPAPSYAYGANTFDVPAQAGEATTMTNGVPNVQTTNSAPLVSYYAGAPVIVYRY